MDKKIELGRQTSFDEVPVAQNSYGQRPAYRRLQSAREIPSTRAEKTLWKLPAALVVAVIAGGIAWAASGQAGIALIAAGILFTPAMLLFFFATPAIAVSRAKGGKLHGQGVVVMVDTSGIIINDDAQQRALIDVTSQGNLFRLAAIQDGLNLAVGDRVEVSFTDMNADVCYVRKVLAWETTMPHNQSIGVPVDQASPAELVTILDSLARDDYAQWSPEENQAIADRIEQLEEDAEVLDREAVGRKVEYDAYGNVVQPEKTSQVQLSGLPGSAKVVQAALLGENDQTRTFWLDMVVTPDSGGESFEAGMRLIIRKTTESRVQSFALPGSQFRVRFAADNHKHVALAPEEIGDSSANHWGPQSK